MDKSASLVFGMVALVWGGIEFFTGSALTLSLKTPAHMIEKADDPNSFYFLCGLKVAIGCLGLIHFFHKKK